MSLPNPVNIMVWVWDTVPSYRLRRADLKTYLTNLFGEYEGDFYIEVCL